MKFTKHDYRMFDMARRVAENSDFSTFHLGTVITYKGKIISTGHNSNKTHTVQKKYNKYRHFNKSKKPIKDSLHSEISALINIPYPIDQKIDYTKVKVYIYRICKGKPLGFGRAFPCKSCLKALRDKGIRHLYFTDDNGFCYQELY